MKKIGHYSLLLATLVFTAVCVWLMPRVNVNSDMTKYLPDDSQMKDGIAIVQSEFDASQMPSAGIKAMFKGLNETERKEIATKLAFYPDIEAVNYEVSKDSVYTLYQMQVSESIDQKSLGQVIKKDIGREGIVETGQDGATPPFIVIIVAVLVVVGILLLMAQSWLDPLLLLFAIGLAVIINIGTNAFLPSVSITTNYIGAILQVVLSLDYAVILMNRFRQELEGGLAPTDAVNKAVRGSVVAILSSALTTVVGLMMLAFMRLKIGLDMGVVLAKGVVCSLICTFTALPALLILCNGALEKTRKRIFVLPTRRLGHFATKYQGILAGCSVVLFFLAFYFSQRTNIYFSTAGESQIEKVFPKANMMVMVYDTQDENHIFALADSLRKEEGVQNIISYPTLLKQEQTADELSAYIVRLTKEMADYMPPMDDGPLEMLSPEVMQMVYYLRSGAGDTLAIGFPELIRFIKEDCFTNPLFADIIDSNIRNQMALLDAMMNGSNEADDEEDDEIVAPKKEETVVVEKKDPTPIVVAPKEETKEVVENNNDDDKVQVISFVNQLHNLYKNETTQELCKLLDTTALRSTMNARQMSEFIGSTLSQTKMVFSFSDKGKRMTPIAYVNFLANDLFNRKSLANMVSESQKVELRTRATLMNYANADARIDANEMSMLLNKLGMSVSSERVRSIANPRLVANKESAANDGEKEETIAPTIIEEVVAPQPTAAEIARAKAKEREKARAARQAALMDELLHSNKRYTATEMTRNFHILGENINPIFVELLYNYYGSQLCYNDSLHMSLEGMLTYVADTMVNDPRFENFLDENSRKLIVSTKNQLAGSMGMLSNEKHSLLIVQTILPVESEQTYAFVEHAQQQANAQLKEKHYWIGESIMLSEMKNGFHDEMTLVTILTVLAIFLIVAISFRSLIVPTILVMTVMTAAYMNVVASGLIAGEMLYLAYLIVQSILMGATIDYGILFTNYYKDNRKTMGKYASVQNAYKGSIGTIMTSGLILVGGPGVMAALVDDVTIAAIVGSIAMGAAVAILLILLVLPGSLVAFDKLVIGGLFGRIKKKENEKK